jgi:hypothetical protein
LQRLNKKPNWDSARYVDLPNLTLFLMLLIKMHDEII